ncbi:unnamed protein product [Closterium sp. NIES-65]|nr:unnamed protein product [Closterium sp. NIES-65]
MSLTSAPAGWPIGASFGASLCCCSSPALPFPPLPDLPDRAFPWWLPTPGSSSSETSSDSPSSDAIWASSSSSMSAAAGLSAIPSSGTTSGLPCLSRHGPDLTRSRALAATPRCPHPRTPAHPCARPRVLPRVLPTALGGRKPSSSSGNSPASSSSAPADDGQGRKGPSPVSPSVISGVPAISLGGRVHFLPLGTFLRCCQRLQRLLPRQLLPRLLSRRKHWFHLRSPPFSYSRRLSFLPHLLLYRRRFCRCSLRSRPLLLSSNLSVSIPCSPSPSCHCSLGCGESDSFVTGRSAPMLDAFPRVGPAFPAVDFPFVCSLSLSVCGDDPLSRV